MSRRSKHQRNGCMERHVKQWFAVLEERGLIRTPVPEVRVDYSVVCSYLSNRLLKYISNTQSGYVQLLEDAANNELLERRLLGKVQNVLS